MLAAGASSSWAQEANDLGAGVMLGDPTGATAKLWLTDTHALDAGLGINTHLTLYGDYLWHSWSVLPQPSEGKLPVYLGLGAQLATRSPNEFGVRTVAGIAYWLPANPVEIFFEVVPLFRFSSPSGTDINAVVGLRYYFKEK